MAGGSRDAESCQDVRALVAATDPACEGVDQAPLCTSRRFDVDLAQLLFDSPSLYSNSACLPQWPSPRPSGAAHGVVLQSRGFVASAA